MGDGRHLKSSGEGMVRGQVGEARHGLGRGVKGDGGGKVTQKGFHMKPPEPAKTQDIRKKGSSCDGKKGFI